MPPNLLFPSAEAHGLELRNNLRRALGYFRHAGMPIYPNGWARAAAYVSKLLDDEITVTTVRRRANEIGLVIGKVRGRVIGQETDSSCIFNAVQEIGPSPVGVSAKIIGSDIGLTAAARSAIGDRQMRRIFACDEDDEQRTKRMNRERAKRARSKTGSTPREQSAARTKPWLAEGISQRTWERRVAEKRHAVLFPEKESESRYEKPPTAVERDEKPPRMRNAS